MIHHKPRIIFLNRSYWPDIEATGQLLTDLCVGLSDRFDVHVVCGQPNSPESGAKFVSEGVETCSGVTVHRLSHRKFDKKNPFGRILNLLSFYRATDNFLGDSDLEADVVVSETDPFLLPIAGARFAERVGASHITYLQDIYPDVAEAVGKSRVPFVSSCIRSKLRRIYQRANRVVVLGRCMRDRLTGPQWGVPRDRIEIIPNWADCEKIQPVDHQHNSFRTKFELDDRFVVMHSGNMGLTQRLDVLIDAANHPDWPERATLLLVGNGASKDRLVAKAQQLDLFGNRVQFLDYQPRSELTSSLSAADVHVVSMHENITGCLCPSKLYGIMAAGRNVIAIADAKTDLCRTINERELGWCVPPGSPDSIAKAVSEAETLASSNVASVGETPASPELNERAREAALQDFDRRVIIERFAEMLSSSLPLAPVPIERPVQESSDIPMTV